MESKESAGDSSAQHASKIEDCDGGERPAENLVQAGASANTSSNGAHGASRSEVCDVNACVLHPDTVAFNSAMWAMLGEPAAAFAELGA